MKKLLFLFLTIALSGGLFAQDINVILGNESDVENGAVISLPLNVENFNNVGSFTFVINYDNSVLTGGSAINVSPDISDDVLISFEGGQVTVDWLGLAAINSGNTKLLDLQFTYQGTPADGKADLAFDANSGVSDELGDPLTTNYTAGYVEPFPILVTAPNGGEVWQAGSNENITWETYQISQLDLEYSKNNGTDWVSIESGLSADGGTYSWSVPNEPSDEVLVRISNNANTSVSDRSDAVFSITEQPLINITSPNGGEEWLQGSTQNITWSSSGVTNLKIEYSSNNGTNWNEVAASVAASAETYEWTVPNGATSEGLIRLSAVENSSITDVSDAVFSIIVPSVSVLRPNGGEIFVPGGQQEIQWESTGVTNVKIEYSTDDGTNWNEISASTPSDGSFDWMVPSGLAGTNAIVKISDDTAQLISDESDASFSIYNVALSLNNFTNITQGEAVTMRVDGSNLMNVGALTIKVNSGNSTLVYNGYENLNSQISTATVNESDGVVIIAWSNINGTTITSDKIIDLNFTYTGTPGDGVTNVTFDQVETEISDIFGNVLQTNYTDGSISPYPLLLNAPNGGEIWQVGDSENITWEVYNISLIDIELSTDNGSNWSTIQSGTDASAGTFSWSVPNSTGNQNLVKITDASPARGEVFSDVSDAVFTIAEQPTVSITSPNGGENYLVGSTHDITWNSININNVKIELSTNNGIDWSEVAASVTASSGSYNWTVPNSVTSEALIRVTDTGNAAVTDVSDAVFSISLPSITVTSPNGGETYIPGSEHQITWESDGVFMFDVDYSSDGGSNWTSISAGGTNSGVNWTVPDIQSENMFVRVTDAENSTITDMSDAAFAVKYIELTIGDLDRLNPGEEIFVPVSGKYLYNVSAITLKINFDSDVFSYLGVEDLNTNLSSALTNAVDGVFTFAWDDLNGVTIEDDLLFNLGFTYNGTPADGAKQVSFDQTGSEISDEIGNTLSITLNDGTIEPYPVMLTAPNGGEIWEIGTTENITYETYNITNVKIEYSTNSGTDWSVVNASSAASGSYAWEIPNPATLNALVRVSDVDNTSDMDVSDATFTISAEGVVEVSTPNGGETLVSGENYSITWQSSAVDEINIEYSTNNGNDWSSVAENITASAGSYNWSVPATPTEEALVRITSSTNPLVTDASNAVFTIVNPFVAVTTPNGGEQLTAGTSYDITWGSAGVADVKIEYTTDNGSSWLEVIATTTSDGTYSWDVPETPTEAAKIRLSDVTNSGLNDVSDAVFSILEPEVLSVAADDIEGIPGAQVTMPINVTAFNEIGAITLRMEYNPLILTFVEAQNINTEVESGILINQSVNGDAVLVSWTDDSPTFTGANIGNGKLFDLVFDYAGGSTGFDFNVSASELANTIGEPLAASYVDGSVSSSVSNYVVVLQPNGGETLLGNSNTTIKWASGGVTTLKAEYTLNNGTDWVLIADDVAASEGEYEWLLPNTNSEEVKVKLTDVSNSLITDESDAVFSINLNASVTVTSPNGGENWLAGSTENITWTNVGLTSVDLEYSIDNGTNWLPIEQEVAASAGSYSWTVPEVNTTEALVRINSVEFDEVSDVSDAVFNISIPLPLSVQAGDVTGEPGTQVTVPVDVFSFNGIGAITLRLEYNSLILNFVEATNINDEVSGGILINQSTNGDAVLVSWTDDSPTFTGANIGDGKLFDLVFEYSGGETDLTFNENISELADTEGNPLESTYINGSVSSSVNNYLTLLSPNGGETFLGGDMEDVVWAQDGATTLTIEYTINDGTDYVLIADNVDATSGSYSWEIPNVEETQVKVRITDETNSALTDESDNYFAITQSATIAVVVPNGGESYAAGTSQSISWVGVAVSLFNIEFSSDNGATWSTVVENYSGPINTKAQKRGKKGLDEVNTSSENPTSGFSYNWSVPLAISDQCKIKVIDASNTNLFDISDAVFSITEPLEAEVILPELVAAFGDSVTIPVVVKNMVNVGAITLNINYDPEVLQWGRVVSFDPQLEGALANGVNGSIIIAWDDLDGYNQLNGTMAEVKMLYLGGYSDLEVNTSQTEFADVEGNTLEVMYTNGNINSVVPGDVTLVSPLDGAIDLPLNVPFVWNMAANTLEYQIQVSTVNDFTGIVADSTLMDTTVTLALNGDTEYFWRVKSINTAGMSGWSATRSFTTAFSVGFANLESPANAEIFKGDSVMVSGKIIIDGLTTGAGQGSGVVASVGYNAANTNPSGWTNWVSAAYSEDSGEADVYTAYIGSNLTRGNYFYAVRFEFDGETFYGGYSTDGGGFWNGTGNVSGVLSVVARPIAAPTQLMAFAPDYESVDMNWIDNSDNETGFKIERKDGDSLSVEPFMVIDSVIADISTYTDTTVEPLALYTYRVFAYNADTVSAFSNLAQVDIPIPVELTSFAVEATDNSVSINWETATETNNKGFEVQRKTEDTWESLKFIDGNGTSSEKHNYLFVDNFKDNSFKGVVYYRLKQVDFDGMENYIAETEIDVDFTPKDFQVSQNYPNPFNPSTTIKYQLPEASSVVITIYNMLGQKVEKLVDKVQDTGYYEVEWRASGYASGMYFYHIELKAVDGNKSHSSVKKMMLMK